ncbi:hypothetical protein MHU86_2763 [Fragilaria crotonensis]|nr:hypothetical protein MHU86_2763 [Fragilaria crotonensis]
MGLQHTESHLEQFEGTQRPMPTRANHWRNSRYLGVLGLYNWVWYHENAGLGETKVGRWLGVSHRIGTLMSFWVLTSSGKVLSRTTVRRMTQLETQLEENKTRMSDFSDHLTERIGEDNIVAQDENGNVILEIDDWDDPAFDPEFVQEFGRTINDPMIKEADQDFTPDSFDDTYLNMELALPREGREVQFGRVVKRLRDKDGLPIGTANDNPILDSRLYEVEFQDGYKTSPRSERDCREPIRANRRRGQQTCLVPGDH